MIPTGISEQKLLRIFNMCVNYHTHCILTPRKEGNTPRENVSGDLTQ